MQGNYYYNIITHNVKRVTSPSEFSCCCAGELVSDIGRMFIFLCNVSRNTNGMSYVFGVRMPQELKNVTIHSERK